MKLSMKSLGVLSISGMLFFSSCGNNSSDPSSASTDSSMQNDNGNKGSANDASSDVDRGTPKPQSSPTTEIGVTNPNQATVDYMVSANTKEMAWLQAGIDRGSKEIKAHSKMMLADHKKLGQQVTALIATKNLTAPPVDTMKAVTINDLKGKEWDKAFVNQMVTDHAELLQKLNDATAAVKDSSLLKLVVATKPIVQSHLDMSKMMQSKMK